MASTRLTGILATLVAFLIAVVAGTALYTSVRFADAERGARAASAEALAYSRALDRLKDAVLDAETGQRGYLLTGDRDYLAPYLAARAAIEPGARQDWALLALQNGEDEELRRLVDFKLTELEETIRLFDAGSAEAALTIIQTDRGREVMRDIRAAIAERRDRAHMVADAAADRTRYYSERSGLVSTLLAALLGLAALMGAVTFYLWTRTDRAETEAEEAADTAERIEVIARELNHRMKNMFAVAQGMLRQSARGRGADVEAFSDEASARITAMSHAYGAASDLGAGRTLSSSELVDRVVRVQLLDEYRLETVGVPRDLPEDAVTPLALILHEWTTNALKYGAWSPECHEKGGGVVLSLAQLSDGGLELVWDETCERPDASPPDKQGYGSKLVRACAAQLGGTVEADWQADGVRYRLRMAEDRIRTADVAA